MNRINVEITKVYSSDGIVLVDMEAGNCPMSAMLIEASEIPRWIMPGNIISAVFKETEVSLAKEFSGKISLRNKLPCIIEFIERGQIMSVITLRFGEEIIHSAITTRSVDSMELKQNDNVLALIKANEITLMQQ